MSEGRLVGDTGTLVGDNMNKGDSHQDMNKNNRELAGHHVNKEEFSLDRLELLKTVGTGEYLYF